MIRANIQAAAAPVRDARLSRLLRYTHTALPLLLALPLAAQQGGSTPRPASDHAVPAARTAYLAGARLLEKDDLAGAEHEFARAAQLDPGAPEYAVAMQLTREHRVTSLVQQAAQEQLKGDIAGSESLLQQAKAIDPQNPLVIEHAVRQSSASVTSPASSIAGAIRLQPSAGPAALHLSGDTRTVLSSIASAYGLHAVFDDTVERKDMRFDMDSATFTQAMPIATQMARVFAVPIDPTTVLFAKDDPLDRQRLEPLLEQTFFLPAMTPEQINEIANVIRTIFGVTRASVQTTLGAIVVRAPESVLGPMNATLNEFLNSGSEVMLDVRLYELDMTRNRNIGATLPTQAGIYNVESEATNLVNSNQSLVQQAIAQGYISPTANNLQIALALIGSGLVQSSLLSSTLGFFGNGLTLTGVTETGSLSFNLGLNEADTRTLDDVEMRVDDRQAATFRSGTRYPIVTSTYTTGISTPASALSNASINGVSVASLLSQYAGGTSATIPQVQYEDLGLTLKATPTVQRSGRIFMALDLKVEALSGSSLDGNPVLNQREFVSSISVGDGETAMLVSNLDRTETSAVSGLPGLTELPGFQIPLDQNAEKDTSQLIALITPHVVRRSMNPFAGPEMLVHVPNPEAGIEPSQPAPPQPAPAGAPVPGAPAPAAPAIPSSPTQPANPGQPGTPQAPASTPAPSATTTTGLPSSSPAADR